MYKRVAVLVILLSLLSACSEMQDISVTPEPPHVLTYTGDMKALFDASCISCHTGGSSGNYNLDTYLGILGNGSDATSNAIKGDANSKIITKVFGGHSPWAGDDDKKALLLQWVVTDSLKEN